MATPQKRSSAASPGAERPRKMSKPGREASGVDDVPSPSTSIDAGRDPRLHDSNNNKAKQVPASDLVEALTSILPSLRNVITTSTTVEEARKTLHKDEKRHDAQRPSSKSSSNTTLEHALSYNLAKSRERFDELLPLQQQADGELISTASQSFHPLFDAFIAKLSSTTGSKIKDQLRQSLDARFSTQNKVLLEMKTRESAMLSDIAQLSVCCELQCNQLKECQAEIKLLKEEKYQQPESEDQTELQQVLVKMQNEIADISERYGDRLSQLQLENDNFQVQLDGLVAAKHSEQSHGMGTPKSEVNTDLQTQQLSRAMEQALLSASEQQQPATGAIPYAASLNMSSAPADSIQNHTVQQTFANGSINQIFPTRNGRPAESTSVAQPQQPMRAPQAQVLTPLAWHSFCRATQHLEVLTDELRGRVNRIETREAVSTNYVEEKVNGLRNEIENFKLKMHIATHQHLQDSRARAVAASHIVHSNAAGDVRTQALPGTLNGQQR